MSGGVGDEPFHLQAFLPCATAFLLLKAKRGGISFMTDTIFGPVIKIINDHSFQIRVMHKGDYNQDEYNDIEIIRIANIEDSDFHEPGNLPLWKILNNKLQGKKVFCFVMARDMCGRVVADVEIL
jgi:hypothetical protein